MKALAPVLALLILAPAPIVHAQIPAATDPGWVKRPSGEDIDAVYPGPAKHMAKSGSVTLSCTAAADGTMTGCTVANETPAGNGFAAAALKLVPLFKLPATTKDGKPVAGATVNIPINFKVG